MSAAALCVAHHSFTDEDDDDDDVGDEEEDEEEEVDDEIEDPPASPILDIGRRPVWSHLACGSIFSDGVEDEGDEARTGEGEGDFVIAWGAKTNKGEGGAKLRLSLLGVKNAVEGGFSGVSMEGIPQGRAALGR